MPELSIVIIHHQTPELLKLCLRSVEETLGGTAPVAMPGSSPALPPAPDKPAYEIIVIDSTISRKARDLIREQFPRVQYLAYKRNLGYSRGVNIGLKRAKGDDILILNPDIIAMPNAINSMLAYMRKHPDIGILGPKLLNFNGTMQKTYFTFYKPITVAARRTFLGLLQPFKRALKEFLMEDADPDHIQTPDWLMGSAIMVSRQAIEQIGGMDERFFMYFEDVDWARRFWHNDYKVVYYPEAVMYHYHQRESKSRLGILDAIFNRKTRWHIQSAIKFFWKYRNLGEAALKSRQKQTAFNV